MTKHYQVSVTQDGKKTHLNHFMQELLAGGLVGMLTPLGAAGGDWKNLEIRVERLAEPAEVVGRESR
jgi:hypothetical protein